MRDDGVVAERGAAMRALAAYLSFVAVVLAGVMLLGALVVRPALQQVRFPESDEVEIRSPAPGIDVRASSDTEHAEGVAAP